MIPDIEFSHTSLEWDKIISALREKASSDLGRKLVDQLAPSADHDTIEHLLDVNYECRQVLQFGMCYPISGCTDTTPVLRALHMREAFLSIDEINEVIVNLEVAGSIRNALNKQRDSLPWLWKIASGLVPHERLVSDVRRQVDENGAVLDGASPTLKRIRNQIGQKLDRLRKRLDDIVKQYSREGLLQESHVTLRGGRYVVPVKESHVRKVQGITHDVSSTGATLFIEPLEVVERNNEISRLHLEEQEEVRRILKEISTRLQEIVDDLESNQDILGRLDFHYACGQLAHRLDAQKPIISRNNRLELRNGRHPLLILKTEDAGHVVPLSVTLGDAYNTLVISGPNAGGKTVALKTVGILCFMVQCGLPVPAAEDSEFPVFKRVIAEIGDPQSIEQDLSTFSARLLNIKRIIDGITNSDLILLDELGAGTDPQEGVSLAIAVIEFLTQQGALTIVTTHHGGLKLYANETDSIENASLAFDEKNLQPTYILTTGIPGSSYALELSKRLGLPKNIIDTTRARLGDQQLKIEDFIRELEARTASLREKETKAAAQQRKLDKLIAEYEEKLKSVQKEYHTKLELAVSESEKSMTEFNRKLEHLVKEIRETKASHESIVKAKQAIDEEKKKIGRRRGKHKKVLKKIEKAAAEEEIQGEIVPGGAVRIKGYEQTGIVIDENKRKKSVTVQLASAKLEISRDSIIPVKSAGRQTVHVSGKVPVVRVNPEIDLRGMAADDALAAVDQYLLDAQTEGLAEVRIIHGKGSGILRKNVAEFLKHDGRIVESRLGAWGEGDTGVTIARIKL